MQEHHSTSSSTSHLAHQVHIQWRGEAQPSHFQISNFEIVFNNCKTEETKDMHVCKLYIKVVLNGCKPEI
jgi:hypothetical protein